MLDPAANLKICDFKQGDFDGMALVGKATGQKGKAGKGSNTRKTNADPNKDKIVSSLRDMSAETEL